MPGSMTCYTSARSRHANEPLGSCLKLPVVKSFSVGPRAVLVWGIGEETWQKSTINKVAGRGWLPTVRSRVPVQVYWAEGLRTTIALSMTMSSSDG